MRKLLSALAAIVFVLGFSVGMGTPQAEAAGGGGSGCYYMCSCEGTPLQCCPTPWGTFCRPTGDIYCPQIITC